LLYPAELPGLANETCHELRHALPYHDKMTCSSGAARYIARRLPFLRAIALVVSAAMSLAAISRAEAQQLCPVAGNERVAVVSVDEQLELALSDGRVLRVAGVEPVRPTPDNPDSDTAARDALRAAVRDGLDIVTLARPDRWGRIPVFAFLPPSSTPISGRSLAAWLLARGDGRFMPEREANICRSIFLDAENAARAARHGLWDDPYYAVIAATDSNGFAEKAATNVIVEGRVTDIDVRPKRIYLLFESRGSGGFAVTLLQRDVRIFDGAGFGFHALVGQRIRVRGLLDLRFGPQIEVSEPDAIEIVPQLQIAPGAGQHAEAKAADPSQKPR
jgi:endonuclease YncB( thermonuclease family)